MLRLPPFDKIGTLPVPDCVNADPLNGQPGSILNMLMFNILQHEGENLALLAGLTPSGTDLTQWAQAASRGGIWAGNLTGTGDLAVATLGVVIPDLLQGMRVGAIATATNTVTNPKLRVTNKGTQGGYTDFPILKEDGSALAIGDIKAGRRYRYEADGAGNVLITGGGIGSASSAYPALQTFQAITTADVALSNHVYANVAMTGVSPAFGTWDAGASALTITQAGEYQMNASQFMYITTNAAAYLCGTARILKNGTPIVTDGDDKQLSAGSTNTFLVPKTPVRKFTLAVGDVISRDVMAESSGGFVSATAYSPASYNLGFDGLFIKRLS